ncbi:Hypothetical predicted protein [Mytilus galloprovincialis]|uniref:Uncharacterized protein n=1 Tax=Mytilus galloprovincialis TaxID=29158 RepID=A0A8B6FVN1_MYTGA|nr:Hypothetical predicted protein [Mytilus galloprovincialis]
MIQTFVTFGPHLNEIGDEADATMHDNLLEKQSSEIYRTTERMLAEARSEMKLRMDKCFSDFSKDMNQLFAKFEGQAMESRSTPILGRGIETPASSLEHITRQDRTDKNNSHIPNIRRSKSDISCKIKPQIYDGSDDLEEYLTQFNLLAELNDWDPKTKALLLASSLSGSARAILNEITDGELHNFECLVNALKSRFGSINRSEVFRAELQTRVRFKNESLPELAQAIKKLTRRAYPGTSPLVRDTLALDSFIDAIPETEVRLRLREVGPKSINEAENIAVRLEALRVADIRKGRNVRIVDIETVQEPDLKREINEIKQSIESLTSEVLIIKNQNDQQFRGDNNYRGNKNNFNRNFNNRGAFRR